MVARCVVARFGPFELLLLFAGVFRLITASDRLFGLLFSVEEPL